MNTLDQNNADDQRPARDVSRAKPQRLGDYVGQQTVIDQVRVALDFCRQTGASYPSSLFAGPPGVGKSQLVPIIAAEMGVRLRETLGQSLLLASDLQGLLLEAQDGDIVFIDEADELPTQQQTLLYRALAERKLFIPRGRSNQQGLSLPLDDFTLIMATNHESKLARPLVERFKIVNRFEFYTPAEIERLLTASAEALGWRYQPGVFNRIATRSHGVPRAGLRLLDATWRVTVGEGGSEVAPSHVERACRIEGIDERGLGRTERKYLRVLQAENGPVRPTVLCDRLGVPLRTLQAVIEPFLLREGLVGRTESGRTLTGEGLSYLRGVDVRGDER